MPSSRARPLPIVSPEALAAAAIAQALSLARGRPLVVGLCGPQGSGKSTLAAAIERRHPGATTLSLDDLYLTRAERLAMARDVHPLFATRGVPGTHDVAMGLDLLATLDRGEEALLPRFDKAADDRAPIADWKRVAAGCPLLLFEGWCVGAMPEPDAALATPVNALERDEDADGRWRGHVNTALAGAYQTLFARLDLLVLLRPASFDIVFGWRLEQEQRLRADRGSGAGVMDDAQLARFVAHYERLTRHIMREMPSRADLVIPLDARRQLG